MMADPLYAELAGTASEILTEFGQDVTLRNNSVGTYDPDTGQTSSTTLDVTRKAAIFDFAQGQTLGPGGLIQRGDKKLIMETGTVPALEDKIIVGGLEYVIIGIGETNPAGVPVAYMLHLRR